MTSVKLIISGYKVFLERLFKNLESIGVDVSGFELDHLGYRTETEG